MTDQPSIIRENVPLAPLTTIGIGGLAFYCATATTVPELAEVLAWGELAKLPVFILGGGSNVLFSDMGFPGIVIQPALKGIEVDKSPDSVIVKVSAGENWDSFAARAVEAGWSGIECLSGIPGSVGAAPIQNIGAYGQEVCEKITEVEVWDRAAGKLRNFSNAECEFAYRTSRFKGRDKDKFVVISVSFCLNTNAAPKVRYAELARHLDDKGISGPTLVGVRQAVLEIRARKAMVIDPAEPNSRSCGSFFTNPIIARAKFDEMLSRIHSSGLLKEGESMPSFDAGLGLVKLSAAWLMERAGFRRGEQHGNVGLSQKHVLAIINRGGGTAAEALHLVQLVQSRVAESFGIGLEPEPVFAGFPGQTL